jgi:hypothetical protein
MTSSHVVTQLLKKQFSQTHTFIVKTVTFLQKFATCFDLYGHCQNYYNSINNKAVLTLYELLALLIVSSFAYFCNSFA